MRDFGLIGTRSRNGVVRILEDVVLSAVAEIVEVIVNGWGECALVHLIPNGQNWARVYRMNEDPRCFFPSGTSRRGSWHHKCSYRA